MLRNEKYHKALHQGHIPTIGQAVRLVQAGLDFYSRQPHSGLGGQTPLEVFEQGRGPGIDETELRHLMMAREIKTIYRNGVKMFDGHYFNEALVGLKGKVVVKYDLEDIRRVLVYGMDGEFLGTAERTHKFDPLMRGDDMAALKRRQALRRRIKRDVINVSRAIQGGLRHGAPELDWQAVVDAVPEIPEALDSMDIAPAGQAADFHADGSAPIFEESYQRYEYLLTKASLTPEEEAWKGQYEQTDEYRTLFITLGGRRAANGGGL